MEPKLELLYPKVEEYLHTLTNNIESSKKIVKVLLRTQLPFFIFVTGIGIYKSVLHAASKSVYYQNSKYPHSCFIKSEFVKIPMQNITEAAPPIKSIDNLGTIMPLLASTINDSFSMIIVCCIISSKLHNDISFTNDSWCPFINLNEQDLNRLEREILLALDYRLFDTADKEVINELLIYTGDSLWNDSRSTKLVNNRIIKASKGLVKKIFCLG